MSLVAKEPRASESNHWYTFKGAPQYTVIGANGKERNTTLRDARTMGLVPSVTTVMNIAAKPALTQWLQKQVLLAALTLPRRDKEAEDDYIARIMEDSKEQGRSAADAGTDIHTSIQRYYEQMPVQFHHEHVRGCAAAIDDHFGAGRDWISEKSFSHELGFGGKCDMHSLLQSGIVADVKTKEFDDPAKVDTYDDHLMQLAAYRMGLGIPTARCANVFVSRSVPGLVVVKEWSQPDLDRGWEMFVRLLEFWQFKNKYMMKAKQ
jgi:hypothetical protein